MTQSIRWRPSTEGSAASLPRAVVLAAGLAVYGVFLATFLYLIGFVGGFGVPKTLDDGVVGSVGAAIAVNAGLLAVFAIQHTVMARPAFKRRWVRIVPPALERTVFVAATVTIMIGLVIFWRPIPGAVWHLEGTAALLTYVLFGLGWGIVLLSTLLIDHFELFGVRQVVDFARGREPSSPRFRERLLYRYTRHPAMLGFLVAFWATPHMTWGHLLFAALTTAYILVGLVIEERTLVALHGEVYEEYRARVPKLIPGLRASRSSSAEEVHP